MDANNAQAMAMAALTAQTLAPHRLDVKPLIHHHLQNPIVRPPPHHSITHPPPGVEVVMSPTAIQHPPYDPQYLHQQQSYGYKDMHINTLFVSGLPDDVKVREIHNLFRRRHGFDSCQLKYTGRGNQVVAFATFFNHPSAMAALNALNGVTFDPQTGATLHIELARSNSRKRPPGSGAYVVIDKRLNSASDVQETWSNDGDDGSDEPSGTNNPNSSSKGDLATAESGETRLDPDNVAVINEQSEKPVAGEVQPCSTLFIANLGPNCTEEELKQVLSQYPGFHVLKMRAKGGMPVAFADFEDVDHATEAMQSLQGSVLASSDRGGMHLEYARSKMRKHQ